MVDEYLTAFYGMDTEYGFEFVYSIDKTPQNDEEFRLHNHDRFYEIYLFLTGNVEFHIEGSVYRAHPHDIFIARPYEMHHNVFLSPQQYERIIIFIPLDFFRKNHCPDLENFFLSRTLGTDCQIPASITQNQMYPLLMKINQYLQEGAFLIAKCVLLEFLYLLNHIKAPLTAPTAEDARIKDILLYINSHLTSPLSLEQLASGFYINKYHLCRIFKSVTGYTVHQYINHKRLSLVQELNRNGQTLLEASVNAGFNSYAHFYRLYRREFGTGPREGLHPARQSETAAAVTAAADTSPADISPAALLPPETERAEIHP